MKSISLLVLSVDFSVLLTGSSSSAFFVLLNFVSINLGEKETSYSGIGGVLMWEQPV